MCDSRANLPLKYLGDFVIVEPIEEGVKVQAEIVHILYPKQIKELVKEGKWCVLLTPFDVP